MKLCENIITAGKGACILQCKVSVPFADQNYLCQRAPNLSILVEKTKKYSGLVSNNHARAVQQRTFHQETRQ